MVRRRPQGCLLRSLRWSAGLALVACGGPECPPGLGPGDDGLCGMSMDVGGDSGAPAVAHGLVVEVTEPLREQLLGLSPLPPLPANPSNGVADDPLAAELGRALFTETRFSRTGELSCASCHDPDLAYSDGERVAFGEELYPRNTGSLVNVGYYEWILWDGGCDALWCQAVKPLENRHEMNANRLEVVHVVAADPELSAAYSDVFGALPDLSDRERYPERGRPDPLDPRGELNQAWEGMADADQGTVNLVFSNLAKALGAFQRTLVSTASPFDTFVSGLRSGDPDALSALSPEAQRGMLLFFGEAGCTRCHDGPLLASDQFVNVGLDTRSWLLYEDNGRFEAIEDLLEDEFVASGVYSDDPEWGAARVDGITQSVDQQAAFRVPSLRNVSRTAPYMHGGHFDTLADVLDHYNTLDEVTFEGVRDERLEPLGRTETELLELEAFLRALELEPVAVQLESRP